MHSGSFTFTVSHLTTELSVVRTQVVLRSLVLLKSLVILRWHDKTNWRSVYSVSTMNIENVSASCCLRN